MNTVESLATLYHRAIGALRPLAPLVTRLLIGHAFLLSGLGKWRNFESTVGFFTDIGIPMPEANAAFIASLEVVGGVMLLIGLGTRVFALLLSSTMVVALLTADRASLVEALSGGETVPTGVVPLVFGAFLLWLVLEGAGRWSLDAVLARLVPARLRPLLLSPSPGR